MKKLIILIWLLSAAFSSFAHKVLFIGDSITDGAWGNSKVWNSPSEERDQNDMNHIYGHGFMMLAAAQLQATQPGDVWTCWNRGISGNTLDDLTARWEKDVLTLHPDVVSILVGTNDVEQAINNQQDIDMEAWAKQLCLLLDQVKEQNAEARFVLCTPFVAPVGWRGEAESYAKRESMIAELSTKIEEVAKQYNAIVVPFNKLIAETIAAHPDMSPNYWIWDGIHPTPAMHHLMAQQWLQLATPFILSSGPALAPPSLVRKGNTAHIVANGKPMLMIGGELGNSSASTPADVQRTFAHLHQLGLNTVLAPVSWELIEPQEGAFDMSSLDTILAEARRNELKVVLLWFGAWKNSMSCYAPEWFKRDVKRFPRAHTMDGKPVEEASSLSKNVLEADKRAFCRILQHLRDHDADQTVVMIQVENEIGMIDVPRDYSADASKLYNSPVPDLLADYLKKNQKSLHPYLAEKLKRSGLSDYKKHSWKELFGDDCYSEEIFQTWTYATYVQQIAEAGRLIYDLPMYVNVALNSRDRKPGQYPSGGPLAHLIDLWHCGAPAIDILGVDIYDKGYKDWLEKYHLANNPLFIPEIRLEDKDAMYALYAFGHHGAMGFCPFSIEDYPLRQKVTGNDMSSMDLSQDDQLNAFSGTLASLSPIAATYQLLRQAEPLIVERQGTKDMDAVLLDNENREAELITADGIRLTIKHSYSLGWEPGAKDEQWPEAACIVLRLAKEDYLVIGSGVVITYSPAESSTNWKKGDDRIGLAKCEIVNINDSKLQIVRHLSGDQTHQGRHVRIPVNEYQMQHFRLYRY